MKLLIRWAASALAVLDAAAAAEWPAIVALPDIAAFLLMLLYLMLLPASTALNAVAVEASAASAQRSNSSSVRASLSGRGDGLLLVFEESFIDAIFLLFIVLIT
jgi:hypothetical protein